MLKRKPKKYFAVLLLGLFFVGILPLAVSLVAIFSPSQVIGESVSSSVTVGNALPSSSGSSVIDSDGNHVIDMQYGTTPREVYCAFDVTDENTCQEVTDVRAVIYKTETLNEDRSNCTPDNDDCYVITANLISNPDVCYIHTSDLCEDANDTSMKIYCKTSMAFTADRTDTDSDETLSWHCAGKAKDGTGWGTYTSGVRFPSELATFRALDISDEMVDFGWEMKVGDTGLEPLAVDVTGNARIGTTVDASDMTCTKEDQPTYEQVLPASGNIRASFEDVEYSSLSTLPVQFNLVTNYSGDPNAETQQSGTVYFGLKIPNLSNAIAGTCEGTVTVWASTPS